MIMNHVRLTYLVAATLVISSGLLLSGCAESTVIAHSAKQIRMSSNESEQQTVTSKAGVYKIGSPYKISGKWYTPHEDLNYSEVGVASWYGPNFHGKRTANGEIFDMYALTAAHRTLPLPSVVRVTNLSNNRSIILRVNDRGPFARNRILDVSKAAAKALDFIKRGTARVRVEVLPSESLALKNRIMNGAEATIRTTKVHSKKSQVVVSAPKSYKSEPLSPLLIKTSTVKKPSKTINTAEKGHFIQVGAFGDQNNAIRLQGRLTDYGPVEVQDVQTPSGRVLHKVLVGPIIGETKAVSVMERIKKRGYVDAHMVVPQS